MNLNKTRFLIILSIVMALGVGLGLSPRMAIPQNDIIYGEDGPIKLISPWGIVILTNSTQVITKGDYVHPTVKRYAFFILDLNDGISINEGGTSWTGVELKASTNNFGMTLANPTLSDKHPCFWSCTEVNSQALKSDECMSFVNCENPYGARTDNRGWFRIKGSIIGFIEDSPSRIYPRKIGVLVCPELLRTTEGNTDWLRSDNDNIVWSYMRTGLQDYETGSSGKAIWMMCEPVCWFSSIPEWANTGVNYVEENQ